MGITGLSEDFHKYLWQKVPSTHHAICPDLATVLQEPGRTESPPGPASPAQLHIQILSRGINIPVQMHSLGDHVHRNASIARRLNGRQPQSLVLLLMLQMVETVVP
jgi:hypothetical protein